MLFLKVCSCSTPTKDTPLLFNPEYQEKAAQIRAKAKEKFTVDEEKILKIINDSNEIKAFDAKVSSLENSLNEQNDELCKAKEKTRLRLSELSEIESNSSEYQEILQKISKNDLALSMAISEKNALLDESPNTYIFITFGAEYIEKKKRKEI